MPRKRSTTTVEEIPQPELEELDAFDRALLEFKDTTGVKLDILRYDRDEGRGKYLKRVDYDPNVMSFEWIRKKWGAGTYQLRFRDAENPSRGWSQVVDIDADENTDQRASSAPAPDTSSPIVAMLQRQNEIMLTALVQNKAGGAGDGTAIVKLIEGLNAQNQTMLSGMMTRADTTGNILTVFEKGLELAREAKAESEGGWLAQIGRIARDLLPALQELNRMRPINVPASSAPGVTRALPGGGPPQAPADAGERAPGAVDTSPPKVEDAGVYNKAQVLEASLRQFAPQLLGAIQSGAPAEDVADQILESIPPVFYPELEALTTDRVLTFEKQLEPHRGWVDLLVRRIKSVNEEEDEESTTDQDNTPTA